MTACQPTAAELWSRFSHELRAWLRARVRPADLADDLLQETFVRICRARPRLRRPRSPGSWVYRVVQSVLVDHVRRQRPEPPPETGAELAAEHEATDAEPLNELVGGWLRQYLTTLPAVYREAIEGTELAGLTQIELARRRGLSLSGSKSRVQRGRALLRKAVLDCCELEIDRRGNVLDYQRRPGCCRGGARS